MWLDTFLAQAASDDAPAADRAAALRWAGELAGLQGDPAAAEARLAESLALARQVGDKRGIAAALGAIASASFHSGDVGGSLSPFAEAVALARELGDARQTAFLLAYLAFAVGHQGDLTRAEALATEGESLVRSLGDARSFEAVLVEMVRGWLALMAGDLDRAQPRLEAALALGRALDAKAVLSVTLAGLGEVALAQGQVEAAARHFGDGVAIGWAGDYPTGTGICLAGLVRAASRGGARVPAARLVGASDAMGGLPPATPEAAVALYDADVARLRGALGDRAFAAARSAGRALPPEAAIAEAEALAEAIRRAPGSELSP